MVCRSISSLRPGATSSTYLKADLARWWSVTVSLLSAIVVVVVVGGGGGVCCGGAKGYALSMVVLTKQEIVGFDDGRDVFFECMGSCTIPSSPSLCCTIP